MTIRTLDKSDRLFTVEVDMEDRSPEEIAKNAALQISALFERLIRKQKEKDGQRNEGSD